MAVLCGMPTIQYSTGRLSVHKLLTYFPHWKMPSVACLRLSDVIVICSVTYLQFTIQACFSSMSVSQAAQRHSWFTQYRTSNVAENLERTAQGNDFKSRLGVKGYSRQLRWQRHPRWCWSVNIHPVKTNP